MHRLRLSISSCMPDSASLWSPKQCRRRKPSNWMAASRLVWFAVVVDWAHLLIFIQKEFSRPSSQNNSQEAAQAGTRARSASARVIIATLPKGPMQAESATTMVAGLFALETSCIDAPSHFMPSGEWRQPGQAVANRLCGSLATMETVGQMHRTDWRMGETRKTGGLWRPLGGLAVAFHCSSQQNKSLREKSNQVVFWGPNQDRWSREARIAHLCRGVVVAVCSLSGGFGAPLASESLHYCFPSRQRDG
jgi:hypothetical protein